jgi:hypothetical protein
VGFFAESTTWHVVLNQSGELLDCGTLIALTKSACGDQHRDKVWGGSQIRYEALGSSGRSDAALASTVLDTKEEL